MLSHVFLVCVATLTLVTLVLYLTSFLVVFV